MLEPGPPALSGARAYQVAGGHHSARAAQSGL